MIKKKVRRLDFEEVCSHMVGDLARGARSLKHAEGIDGGEETENKCVVKRRWRTGV